MTFSSIVIKRAVRLPYSIPMSEFPVSVRYVAPFNKPNVPANLFNFKRHDILIPFCSFSSSFLAMSLYLPDCSDIRLDTSYGLIKTLPSNNWLLEKKRNSFRQTRI